jgi:hypothetical protein
MGSQYMCDMVVLDGKGNILEPGNRIPTSMSNAIDLLIQNSIGNIFRPWVVHITGDMVTLGGKGNILNRARKLFLLQHPIQLIF